MKTIIEKAIDKEFKRLREEKPSLFREMKMDFLATDRVVSYLMESAEVQDVRIEILSVHATPDGIEIMNLFDYWLQRYIYHLISHRKDL